jgi:hypothetical protein
LIGELRRERTGRCPLGEKRTSATSAAKAVERHTIYGTAEAMPFV